ncbi:hypothetical protein [Magnetococcus sp. PR-3]|uniref:hypothetical protein n=1 Tax=Magnetococcus sp. PR-3 TaxID=3120355 RepID=UPI002FCE085E
MAAVERMEKGSEVFYHIGSGVGGIALLVFGAYAVFGAPNKYEQTALKIDKTRLELERDAFLREMKFKHAIDTLEAFEKARDSISLIRHFLATGDELEELAKLLPDNSDFRDESGRPKNYQGLQQLLSMQREWETVRQLHELRPRFQALFQDVSPFTDFWAAWRELDIAARRLMDESKLSEQVYAARNVGIVGGVREEQLKNSMKSNERKKLSGIIWDSGEDNPYTTKINGIVDSAYDICKPWISDQSNLG